MKDYTIWLNGGNSIGGTAEESELIKLKEYFIRTRNVRAPDNYENYEFEDAEGIVCMNLFDVQAIAITKCTENRNVGFSPYKLIGDKEICLTSQKNVNKCMKELTNKLMNGLNSIKR